MNRRPVVKVCGMMNMENCLRRHDPSLIDPDGMNQAAVAMVIRELDGDPEMLFIQRSESHLDPWSGQIAFPGGGRETRDSSLLETAIRETSEEIRVDLHQDMQMGRLDDQQGRSRNRTLNLTIACFVFHLTTDPEPLPNDEVAEVFWIPVSTLRDGSRRTGYQTPYRSAPYPAMDLGRGQHGRKRILWGLTFRFVQHFLRITAS